MAESQHNWLDTETKACLQRIPPIRLAPPATDAFTVVVLHHPGKIDDRGLVAFQVAFGITIDSARALTAKGLPFTAQRGLTEADALLAQFELICCDIVSVFIADSVVSQASPDYLANLYNSLIHGDEFSVIQVVTAPIPETEQGDRFCRQFFGRRPKSFPHKMIATFKKARIMQHWAATIGASVSIDGGS